MLTYRAPHAVIATLCLATVCSACLLPKYSRRDRFAKQVIQASNQINQKHYKRVLGQPDAEKQPGSRAMSLTAGASIVLKMSLPTTYNGYSEAVSVHVPKASQDEGEYFVAIGPSPSGPWQRVGRALRTKSFDINGVPFSQSQYVKLSMRPKENRPLWVDAVRVRVHLPTWQPLFQRPLPNSSTAVKRRAQKRARAEFAAATALFEQNKYQKALERLLPILPRMKQDAAYLYQLAAVYHALDKHFQSIRIYNKAQARKKPNHFQLQEIGENYLHFLRLDLAERAFAQCTRLAPLYPRCYYYKIQIASERGKPHRHIFRMRQDQYLLIKERTDISRRQWGLRRMFSNIYGNTRTPFINTRPEPFTYSQMFQWFGFLLKMFPEDRAAVLQEGEGFLYQMRQRYKRRKNRIGMWRASLYRAALTCWAGFNNKGNKLLQQLRARSSQQQAEWAMVKGDLALRRGRTQRAQKWFKKGLRFAPSEDIASQLKDRLRQLQQLAADADGGKGGGDDDWNKTKPKPKKEDKDDE